MSLDGYIAGPKGEFDWIVPDPEIDFAALFGQFDTLLIGRRTFEFMKDHGQASIPGMKMYIFSRTLNPQDHPGFTIVSSGQTQLVEELKKSPGKDIWLFGGGELFHELYNSGLVDTVEVTIIPILLGGGTALLPAPASEKKLKLASCKIYKSGSVYLAYEVQGVATRRSS